MIGWHGMRRRVCRAGIAGAAAAAALVMLVAAVPNIDYNTAILQGLNKVTARISSIRAPVGVPVHFGTLEIVVRACRKTPPEEPPEAAAFLEIHDIKPGEAPVEVFSGWMFASSPALSALEHPVYDVTVVDCINSSSSSSPSSR